MSLDLNSTDYYINKQLHCSTIRIMLCRNSRQVIIESLILLCEFLFLLLFSKMLLQCSLFYSHANKAHCCCNHLGLNIVPRRSLANS